jgi:uncharacterized protein YndB with AHSA1/START domain
MSLHLTVTPQGASEVLFARSFSAPRPVVWRAMTDPALILRWLWARDHPMTRCDQDLRPGGSLRWEWAMPGGGLMGVSGRYLEIVPPARIVHTELFDEDWTGGETKVSLELEEMGPEHTLMRLTVTYPNAVARAAALATPMAEGMDEGYARLETLLPLFKD